MADQKKPQQPKQQQQAQQQEQKPKKQKPKFELGCSGWTILVLIILGFLWYIWKKITGTIWFPDFLLKLLPAAIANLI